MKWTPLVVLLLLAACIKDEILPGKRISVFDLEKKLRVEKNSNKIKITLPRAKLNKNWSQMGLNPMHRIEHLALGKNIKEVRRTRIGSKGDVSFIGAPIITEDRIFVLDGQSTLFALDKKTNAILWQRDFYLEDSFGGTLAYAGGRLFIATGGGTLAALAASNGDILWKVETGLVYRAAPVVWQGKVFFMSFDNQLSLYDGLSGSPLWTHRGIFEPSSLLHRSAPAVEGGVVIVPYNSGEIFALRAGNKEFIWTDNLLRQGVGGGVGMTGFIAPPVMDKRAIYAISSADYFVAINKQNGKRMWSQSIRGINMPWLVGNQIFVLTLKGRLLALDKRTGNVLWSRPLDNKVWYGPVLAGGILWLTSADGKLLAASPSTGKVLSTQRLSREGFASAPVVAGKRMWLLSNGMELIELRGE